MSPAASACKIVPPAIRVEPAISINDNSPETVTATAGKSARRLLSLTENEEAHIRMVLSHTGGRISGPRGAAKILGVPPSTLRSRIKKLGLKIHVDDSQ